MHCVPVAPAFCHCLPHGVYALFTIAALLSYLCLDLPRTFIFNSSFVPQFSTHVHSHLLVHQVRDVSKLIEDSLCTASIVHYFILLFLNNLVSIEISQL